MSNARGLGSLLPSLVLMALVPWGLVVAGQTTEGEAERIIEDYLRAVGGRSALEAVGSRVIKGTFAMPDMGMYAPIEIHVRPPDMALVSIDIAEVGGASNGVNGDVVWEINPMAGPRVLRGGDRLAGLRQAEVDPLLNWRKHFTGVESAGSEQVRGRTCEKLVLHPPEGDPITAYFDAETHLLTRMRGMRDGQPVDTYLSDYRPAGGVLMPHKSEMVMTQFAMQFTIEEVEVNVDIPDDVFALPPSIASLAARDGGN